jgi:phage gpG-like protein
MADLGKNLATVIRPALIATALDAEKRAKKSVTAGESGLHRRTGKLAASIAGKVITEDHLPAAVLSAGGRHGGKDVRYAAIHELGGTVEAKPGKLLRIPLPEALTAAGVDRYGGRLRQMAPDKFVLIRSKKGNLLLMDRETWKPWYVLREQVTIEARPYLRPSLDAAGEKLEGRITSAVQQAMGVE